MNRMNRVNSIWDQLEKQIAYKSFKPYLEFLKMPFYCLLVVSLLLFIGPAAFSQTKVVLKPGDEIQKAVDAHPEGTLFILKPGLYRMQDVKPKDKNQFIGEKGAILNGSRLLKDWKKEGKYWVHDGQTQQGQRYAACVKGYAGCQYPEDIYKNDYPLRQDTALLLVEPGEWFFDYDQDKVYLLEDPTRHKMEISVSRRAFGGNAKGVAIRGLVVEKYAIPGHMGAIGDQYPGEGWIIENNEIRLNHGKGLSASHNAIIRGNYIHHNGQMGMTANGKNILVENNEIAYNTLKEIGYNWEHEGGGTKFAYTDSLVVRNNYVHHNWGPGLWTDIKNKDALYEGNICTDNLASGIFHEISYSAIIRHNYVARNATVHGAQLFLSTSSDVEIHHNEVVVDQKSGDGIIVRQSKREVDGVPIYGINNYVHHNTITYFATNKRSGAWADYEADTFWKKGNNRFNYNTYFIKDAEAHCWEWSNGRNGWKTFRECGQEANGRIKTQFDRSKTYPEKVIRTSAGRFKVSY
ncbi:right-handed parallel beta-helix repeat-containing protein [Rhodocytophaga aerolata]